MTPPITLSLNESSANSQTQHDLEVSNTLQNKENEDKKNNGNDKDDAKLNSHDQLVENDNTNTTNKNDTQKDNSAKEESATAALKNTDSNKDSNTALKTEKKNQ